MVPWEEGAALRCGDVVLRRAEVEVEAQAQGGRRAGTATRLTRFL